MLKFGIYDTLKKLHVPDVVIHLKKIDNEKNIKKLYEFFYLH